MRKHGKMTIRMAYEMVMPYHLHMPSYFLETFTEYPYINIREQDAHDNNTWHNKHLPLLRVLSFQ